MKRVLVIVVLLLGSLLVVGWRPDQAHAQNTQNFTIESFEADYYLSKTDKNVSTMKVVEKITAEFPDFDQNHGILRAIPKEYKNNNLSVSVESVVNPIGTAYRFSTYTENDNLVLRIGDPDSYVHGQTTYIITYQLRNVISFYDSHDELYWDVNGDQWPQAMGAVTARLHLPPAIASRLNSNQVSCFAGLFQRSNRTCEIVTSEADQETVVTATAKELDGYETLSMVVGFSKGTFEPDRMAALVAKLLIAAIIGGILLPPLLTLAIVYRKWHKVGRDPKGRGVIIPQYQAPKGLTPAVGDMVLGERLSNKAITATIIDLAVRGYIIIFENVEKKLLKDKKDYTLKLSKAPRDLSKDQMDILRIFFGTNPLKHDEVKLSSLKSTAYTQVAALGKTVSRLATDAGYFVTDPSHARRYFLMPAILLLVIGFVISFTVVGIPLGIGLVLSAVVLFIANLTMPARTPKGVEQKEYILGMKDYIQMAEVDRLEFLQSVKGAERVMKDNKAKIKLFESLLPYAMLFGLEKSWAAEFQDIYTQPPDWYSGNWSTFNTVYLASSLSNFTAVSGVAFSPPSSSSSSGLSGGGGFSGGGGGGGGGGGW